jgi:hypothetical protein
VNVVVAEVGAFAEQLPEELTEPLLTKLTAHA